MICRAETKEIDEIRSTNILPQTPFWAHFKEDQGFMPGGFQLTVSEDLIDPSEEEDHFTNDDLLVLLKKDGHGHCYAYVPYGPKVEPRFENYGLFLEEVSEALRPHLPSNCIFIRYDLLWENQWSHEEGYFDEKGNWTGPPPDHTQEFRVNYKTRKWNLRKSPADILPKNTFFLNLRANENELLYRMRYNTRYNIRRAFKKGVRVQECGMDSLNEWYALYKETAKRNKMAIQGKDYFSALFRNHKKDRSGVDVKLMMADHKGEFLSAMFLVLSNKRAFYLFGASSNEKKHMRASYALQWEAIRTAKCAGCSEYDMFGCAPNLDRSHPLHGVHLYKKGFGGKLYNRMGCWDYPLDADEYEIVRVSA